MNIAICDDEHLFCTKLKTMLEQFFSLRGIPCAIHLFISGQDLLHSNPGQYDLIFLDMRMEEMDGFAVGQAIRAQNGEVQIIYVSSLLEYAPLGYQVGAFRYLLKTDLERTLDNCLLSAMQKLGLRQEAYHFTSEGSQYAVYLEDILYFESRRNKVIIYVKNHTRQSYGFYAALTALEHQLPHRGFLRIHKSYLVNMSALARITNYKAYLHDETVLPVSRNGYAETLGRYTLWKGRNL